MSEQLSLSTEHALWLEEQLRRIGKNPMAAKHGCGPDASKCGECRHLVKIDRWYKCRIRGISKSTATDHRLSWNSCRLFDPSR
jgi:hypothetical protein